MLYRFEYKLTKKRYTYDNVMSLAKCCKSYGIDTHFIDIYAGTHYFSNLECMKHLIDLLISYHDKKGLWIMAPVDCGVDNIWWRNDDLQSI